ncbi:hypothetical protein A2Z00_02895 [Candidatus Gottesmanbacteria bacterium RBG_13_45_10]|uniref:Xylose isomerase-like TIM barrel domain-containing protein n=1 Tax=Candidatus Gottesmanbacteria bacterium RBG_13_45_10 TaxID=1798370 RepID=A0A1F5ZG46_9BACT|nr:MAG: hypothetical protein A2Z00_02895 [Candidatus Gottesmanbacteria bacterium RBG_13_45_10]
MKLGIKVNADKASIDRLNETNPAHAEVWFNVNEAKSYTELFDELKLRNMDVGLHFWGTLEGSISPNIAYPDDDLIQKSMDLMRQSIDIAAVNHFQYVNIHPGAQTKSKVNYSQERYDVISAPVDIDKSIPLFLENAKQLSSYAQEKNVVFTVETVPARITQGWYDAQARLQPKNMYELPVSAIVQAASQGLTVANDFCHTAANVRADNPNEVWEFLLATTKTLVPKTRVIHLGFVVPPYNGTDLHDSLDNPVLDTDFAVPNKRHMIDLLELFQNRDDIWILVEPKSDHVENYFLAREILQKAEAL